MLRKILILLASAACAQTPDPFSAALQQAYQALRARQYDTAIAAFQSAIQSVPDRPAVRKDLAYTYLKIGDTEAARNQFAEAMRLDPKDLHVALEYAFLCHETKKTSEARRVFDRIRKSADAASRATAEQAFQNIDRPLVEGIARWTNALAAAPDNFSAHRELASLHEQREEFAPAADHFLAAWKLKSSERGLLLDLARCAKAAGRADQSTVALLAASRGGEPRTSELARELLPPRYPYVYEFRQAAGLDPRNADLRRELAFLMLAMGKKSEAEIELAELLEIKPDDTLANAQLGLMLLARHEVDRAMPYLNKVLESGDEELANRVRAALRVQQFSKRTDRPREVEAKGFAERSFKAGYFPDAAKYYKIAHENNPGDFDVILKLAWTYNLMHQDAEALKWFAKAREANDPQIVAEAKKGYSALRSEQAPVRLTTWVYPMYSSRWKDLFSYGQVKTEFRLGSLPVRPYVSLRFVGDTRHTIGIVEPQYLSESALILGAGLATKPWHGLNFWGEAGEAFNYLKRRPDIGKAKPDYRGGATFARAFGHLIGTEKTGLFFETNNDALFVSRFDNDFLMYSQNRLGLTLPPIAMLAGFQAQLYWNGNYTRDLKREPWANFAEAGPGFRFRFGFMPRSLMLSASFLRGSYTIREGNPYAPVYYDMRAGLWYAFTH